MKFITKKSIITRRVAALAMIVGIGGASASAISFTYSQTGYDEGASIMGSFSGSDSNSDGWLTHFSLGLDQELTDFSLSFSGNSIVEAFSFGLSDLQEFSFFMMGDNMLGNDFSLDPFSGGVEGISVFDFNFGYFTGQASNFVDGGTVQNFSTGGMSSAPMAVSVTTKEKPTVSVPDSGNAAVLLLSSLGGLLAIQTSLRRVKKP